GMGNYLDYRNNGPETVPYTGSGAGAHNRSEAKGNIRTGTGANASNGAGTNASEEVKMPSRYEAEPAPKQSPDEDYNFLENLIRVGEDELQKFAEETGFAPVRKESELSGTIKPEEKQPEYVTDAERKDTASTGLAQSPSGGSLKSSPVTPLKTASAGASEDGSTSNGNTPPGQKKNFFLRRQELTVSVSLIVLMLLASLGLFIHAVYKGAAALKGEYSAAFSEEKEAVFTEKYQENYAAAEEAVRAKERDPINFESLRKMGSLEILKVQDVEFMAEDPAVRRALEEGSSGNAAGEGADQVSWYEIHGSGVFEADLTAAEFVMNKEKSSLLVRLPYPELTDISLDHSNVYRILYEADGFKGRYQQDKGSAEKPLEDADLFMKAETVSDEQIMKSARQAAASLIRGLLKEQNPTYEDLEVEVEFY
ncbi:MAG: DUF4230 domain-containing protein, partial [Lachnospiraceae bacterium]|nr:DUF4230 domain-containing protein [Lachnospiraceae bacterium]